MAVFAGNLTSVGTPLQWSLLFARQPEPDLEFTEEELDQTTATRPISPMKPGKKSGGGRPLLWILLLALVGGIGYIAMEPEQLMDWLAPLMGESALPESPPIAMRPKPSIPTPAAPAMQPAPGDTAPIPSTPAATAQAPVTPAQTPSASAPTMTPLAPAANQVSSPMFAEAQKVTVIGNPAVPTETIPLMLDPAGTKPGPVVRPGMTLTILDGDLQPGGWVYSVRTDEGTKGWISEKRLRLKF
jgi:biotin carboxyl carrier protein